MRDKIIKALQEATGEKEIHLEFPENEEFGDYATNVAMVLAKKKKKNPKDLPEEIVIKLKKDKNLIKIVSKIQIAGPGFINFFLSKEALFAELKKAVREKDKYGSSSIGKGKTVIVEYSSPNIAKRFSIGHLRSTIIGQALYNLYKFLGYKVIGDNHIGDWGTQFGMIIAQVVRKNLNAEMLTAGDFERLYVEFNKEMDKKPELRDQAKNWFRKLEEGDKKAKEIWKKTKDTSLKEFSRIYKLLGVEIDNAYGESFYEDKMKAVVDEVCKEGLMKKSRGAEIVEFPSTGSGQALQPAMLTKSDWATTYYTRDLATVKFRMEKFKPDIVIYEVGSEQKLHFKQVFATAELLGWLNGTELVHVAHGLIRFPHGKMATRRGETVKLESVLDEAVARARKIIKAKPSNGTRERLSNKEKEEVAKVVGIGAIKYFDLSHHPASDIIFDWEKMFVLEGNSAPYLQYTVARTNSVLAKLKTQNPKLKTVNLNKEEMTVLRRLPKFPEVVAQAAQNYSPNLLCNYLFDLAQKYNNFYARHRILDTSSERTKSKALSDNQHRIIDSDVKEFRVSLTSATGQTLKNGLRLLGIQAPSKM